MTVSGKVNDRLEAVLRLRVRGPSGTVSEFDAVVDTGYTGLSTLPTAAAERLGLERGMGGQATLADGSARRFDTFSAELAWGVGWRDVVASALGSEVLVGMRLLAGHELRVQVVRDGAVEVTALPPSGPADRGAAAEGKARWASATSWSPVPRRCRTGMLPRD